MSDRPPISGFRKTVVIACTVLCLAGIAMLVKTEFRKWFGMDGKPTPANTGVFWISFGWSVLFGYAALRLWPPSAKEGDK